MSDGNMEPLDWFIKKLYRSLKTPTSRLNNETGYNDGTEMLREELKFAKMIIRQQQRFAQGIKRAFITHLKFKDMFDDWDLFDDNIRVEFNVPTNFYDMRESQKLNLKIETFNNITGNEMVSTIYAMKKYLDWRDSDILANLHFKKVEAEHMFEIEQIKTLGPNYKELLAQQAGGEAGGDMGAMGGSSGGGGMPPDFGGSGAAITDSEAPNVEAPLDQAETPEAPSNEPEMGV
jgi:hypothetical protein